MSPRARGAARRRRIFAALGAGKHAEAYEAAERLFDPASPAQQRARLLLAYGQWLRRQRRIADSCAPLRDARDAFDAMGCAAWGDQARRELRASGESSRRRDLAARPELAHKYDVPPAESQAQPQTVACGQDLAPVGGRFVSRQVIPHATSREAGKWVSPS